MDPRRARTRDTALAAALDLLSERGVTELTHQNLAHASGVSRATLYRHWPTTVDLVIDLLDSFRMPNFVPGEGSVAARVEQNLDVQRERLADPRYARLYQAVQSVSHDDRVRERLVAINKPRVQSVADALAPEYDLHDRPDLVIQVLALMNGPLNQLATFVGTDLPDATRRSIVDSVLLYLERAAPRTA